MRVLIGKDSVGDFKTYSRKGATGLDGLGVGEMGGEDGIRLSFFQEDSHYSCIDVPRASQVCVFP